MAYGTLKSDVVQSSTAGTPPQFNDGNGTQTGTLCRAWVNFDGTTSPGTIRSSFNVSSVTRGGTGDYTVNLTNAMSDANFSVASISSITSTSTQTGMIWNGASNTTSSFRLFSYSTGGVYYNEAYISAQLFR